MQHTLRPYATAGVALVGASIIAVTPVAVPLPEVQAQSVRLVDAWSELITDTTTNLQLISANADPTAISGVFSALLTNPLGVIGAFSNLTPTVTSDLATLPGTISVQLPPGLEVLIAQLGAEGATFNAINDVVAGLATNPSSLLEAPATILNAYLNGVDNISLLNGIVNIAGFNGILAPLQDVSINLNLPDLLDALGVGNVSLSSLGVNLGDLLEQIGLGKLDLGGLFDALKLSDDGLGTLLGNPTLTQLLGDLGLENLGLGNFSLTDFLSDLGLNTTTNLNNLSLDSVLNIFGINPSVDVGLSTLLTNLGFGTFVNEDLGNLVSSLGLLTPLTDSLNGVLGGLLNNPILENAFQLVGIDPGSLLTDSSLLGALNDIQVSDLLGGQTLNESLSSVLTALGVSDATPTGLSVADLLEGLGFPTTTGDLTLTGLLGSLGAGSDIGDLLNTVSLGDLLTDLNLSDLPLNLSNIGDLGDLTVGGLLGDLGLGDIAAINIDGFGGLSTLLTDVIPQQILAALGG